MKNCPVCKTDKSLDQYWKGQYCCIDCQKEKQKKYWASRQVLSGTNEERT